MNANFHKVFSTLMPEGMSLPNAGELTVWAIVLIVLGWFARWLWKAFEDELKTWLRWLLRTWPRRIYFLIWFGFVAFACGRESKAMLWASLVAPLVAWLRVRRRLPLGIVTVVSLIAMAGSYGYDSWQWREARQTVRVYFVLGFENNGNAADELDVEKIWRDCKVTLQDQVFQDIAWLHINPKSEDYKINRWSESHVDRVMERGFPPEVLLKTTVELSEEKPRTVTAVSELMKLVRPSSLVLAKDVDLARQALRKVNKNFMPPAMAAWLWRWLEDQNKDRVRPSDASTVNKRILSLYANFLESQDQDELLARVKSAPYTDEAVRDLLNQYQPGKDTNASVVTKKEKAEQIASRLSPESQAAKP